MSAPSDEDDVYPTALTDADGQPFDSSQRYLLHFGPGQTPPAEAFQSLTTYDGRQLFTANAINRFAIGDRDAPTFNGMAHATFLFAANHPGRTWSLTGGPRPRPDRSPWALAAPQRSTRNASAICFTPDG